MQEFTNVIVHDLIACDKNIRKVMGNVNSLRTQTICVAICLIGVEWMIIQHDKQIAAMKKQIAELKKNQKGE